MEPTDFSEFNEISLKDYPYVDETKIHKWIAKHPRELGLGNIELLDKERRQPNGRLDLLFTDGSTRYEVEVQLGSIDGSHLIRTLDYWDIERRNHKEYEHCAVIIAEKISGARFFNLIHLLNTHIPIIAIQMNAYEIDGKMGLVFTKIVDKEKPQTDRIYEESGGMNFWQEKLSKTMFSSINSLLNYIHGINAASEPSYLKSYISVKKYGIPDNFVTFKPKKSSLKIELKHNGSNKIKQKLVDEGMSFEHDSVFNKITINENDLVLKLDFLKDLLKTTYDEYYSN